MTIPEQAPAVDWDVFEMKVLAHKQAVARVTRVEDQLIEVMRSHLGDPPPEVAGRYTAVLDEARAGVMATANALFPPGAAAIAAAQAIARAAPTET